MADVWITPNAEQEAQARLVQHDVVELINRLCLEGIDRRVIMAGLGTAIADLVTCTFGPSAVVPWFQKQADICADLRRES